ncbi:MAG: hypothetical protein KBD39_10280 [Sterolibacterium sp.]|nr:hypothetical protein [Sterolibacterium sp.]MBP9800489.1 hypothetical protein [Sterolibacterium sp.]
MKTLISFLSIAILGTAGCSTTHNYLVEKHQTVEYYRIFDIKTTATRQAVAKAAGKGLGRNVNNAQEVMPIPASADIPEIPGRFKLVNPFEGSKLAALAGGAGSLGLRMATCDGAVWTAKAERRVANSNTLNLSACLFQYQGGYHLDLYAQFTKQEGGLLQISRDMASAMVGSPEEWTEKTFLDTVRSIRSSTGANITLLEAQPELSGTPWLDDIVGH